MRRVYEVAFFEMDLKKLARHLGSDGYRRDCLDISHDVDFNRHGLLRNLGDHHRYSRRWWRGRLTLRAAARETPAAATAARDLHTNAHLYVLSLHIVVTCWKDGITERFVNDERLR